MLQHTMNDSELRTQGTRVRENVFHFCPQKKKKKYSNRNAFSKHSQYH